MARIWVGMSGWTSETWKGSFYPKKLSAKKELNYASERVNSIEINGTFYRLQTPESFQRWYDETPSDFRFAVKAGQYITHVRRLKDINGPLANFFASGLLCLREKMGPILWQFPPYVMLKDDRFEKFMKLLPHDSKDASKLAKKHTEKVEGRAFTKAPGDFPIRHAFEFRHESFMEPSFIELMAKNNVALVFAHAGAKSPYREDVTADFIYARMHGENKEHKKGYSESELDAWVQRLRTWSRGSQPEDRICVRPDAKLPKKEREVFIYFDNEQKKFAPVNATQLLERLRPEEKSLRKPGKKAS